MAFRDLQEFLSVKPVLLPIRGKTYAFPGDISAAAWLRLQTVGDRLRGDDSDAEAVSDADEANLRAEMFGDAAAEMVADGCTGAEMQAVFVTLISYHLAGRSLEAAELVWSAQGEASAPNRTARRSKTAAKPARLRGSRAGSNDRPSETPAPAGRKSSSAGH